MHPWSLMKYFIPGFDFLFPFYFKPVQPGITSSYSKYVTVEPLEIPLWQKTSQKFVDFNL